MAINAQQTPPKAPSIEFIDDLYGKIEIGNAAETVIRTLDPIVERRLGLLLNELGSCPADLSLLLDIRAKISEVWRLRKEITEKAQEGKIAIETLKNIFEGGNGKIVRLPDKIQQAN